MVFTTNILLQLFKNFINYSDVHISQSSSNDHIEEEIGMDEAWSLWCSETNKQAISVLKGFLKGIETRKKTNRMIIKAYILEKSKERLDIHKIEKQTLIDRSKTLEEEIYILRQTTNVKCNDTYLLSFKMKIEQILHTRQIHHLRKKN